MPILKKNQLIGRGVTLVDITQQKKSAKDLQELKERYETIFISMRDAVFVESLSGIFLT